MSEMWSKLLIMKSAVYAGSFDPPTLGHLDIIKRASKMFDNLYILIANNPSKTPYFSDEERMGMLEKVITVHNIRNASVLISQNDYVVSVARNLKASFLVRGIRDTMDYGCEQNIFQVNKNLAPEIETVYLMADSRVRNVSSSTVKQMIGFINWTDSIDNDVDPLVLEDIKIAFLKRRIEKLEKRKYCYLAKGTLAELIKAHHPRSYHNLNHIIECVAWLDKLSNQVDACKKDEIECALLFHDVCDSIKESAEFADQRLRFSDHSWKPFDSPVNPFVYSLIEATDHFAKISSNKYTDLIRSIDLAILGYPRSRYLEYVKKVRQEYKCSDSEWQKGRSDFIKKMLAKNPIYPNEIVRNELEETARENLNYELEIMEKEEGLLIG